MTYDFLMNADISSLALIAGNPDRSDQDRVYAGEALLARRDEVVYGWAGLPETIRATIRGLTWETLIPSMYVERVA